MPGKFRYGLTNEDMFNILVTAFEGGIGYWAQIHSYKKNAKHAEKVLLLAEIDNEENIAPYAWLPLLPDCGVYITDATGEEAFKKTLLDRAKLVKGLEIVHTVWDGRLLGQILSGQYDAGGADVFVQLCLFGEEVFG